jgi:hypothetical protein
MAEDHNISGKEHSGEYLVLVYLLMNRFTFVQ